MAGCSIQFYASLILPTAVDFLAQIFVTDGILNLMFQTDFDTV